MPFATAAAIAGGVSAAAGLAKTVIGGSAQSGAVSGAADQARSDLQPWRGTGQNALMVAGDLSGANGPDAATAAMGNFFTSPGYQFRLGEGQRAIDAGAASKGILRSGATIKAEDAYGQGLASSEFENYYNRLFGLAKMGESAATGQADTAQALGKQQASIFGNEAGGIGSAISGLASNPSVVQGVNSLFNQQSFGNNTNFLNNSVTEPGFGSGGVF